MNARARAFPPTQVKFPTATSRVPAGSIAKRRIAVTPALEATRPRIRVRT